ncbi:hypothetical protein MMC15_004939 [Xylographa vitiligo]|nr:hypothetical protein [Xylographa vitiligo]
MTFPILSFVPFLLLLHASFRVDTLAAALSPGKVALYDDFDCEHPSSLNPSVLLAASTCLVVTNGEGLVISELPQCDTGSTAIMIYYSDPACVQQTTSFSTDVVSPSCEQLAAGTGLYDVRSVMFACQAADQNPQPTATTTAVVSGVPVATGGSSPSSSGSVTPSPAPTSTGVSGSGSTTGSTMGSGSGSGTTSSTSTSGLSTSDIIAIAVGAGVGIPALLVAICAWLFPNMRHRLAACLHFGGGLPTDQHEMSDGYGPAKTAPGPQPYGMGNDRRRYGDQRQRPYGNQGQQPYGHQGQQPYGHQGQQPYGHQGQPYGIPSQHESPPPYNG